MDKTRSGQSDRATDTNHSDGTPRPPEGYAKEGNFDQPRSFEPGTHDPSPAPEAGSDPEYGDDPDHGGFQRDRQGNERDKQQVTVNGTVDSAQK
ncbi:hypothetical protein BWI17_11285 [Betaproteobacteria bacterium GR16-43]|nr:hypothetical protein BWI17_11285 [Betaproteobacteria bacterium GR16-43]